MTEKSRRDIRFVYFDLGNVLLQFDPQLACANLARRCAVSAEDAQAAVYKSGLQEQFEQGLLTGQSFAEKVAHQLGLDIEAVVVDDLLHSISNMFTPIDAMNGVLRRVRQEGFGVGLLSNTCHAHWDWITRQAYPVLDFEFDATVLSFEVRAMKPDPVIYEKAERAAAVEPGAILFLDDRPENVQAAQRRGWHAVQCYGGRAAIDALHELQVLKADV